MGKKNTKVGVAVTFKSNTDTKTSKAVVHGVLGGIPLPFPIPNDDGCKSNVHCPITNGATNVYENGISIQSAYPKVQVIVRWELKDEQGNDLFCFSIPAQIVD